MHPLTLDCPKPLLPVGARSLVEHQIDRVVAAGAERVVLATGYRHADFAHVVARARAAGTDVATVEEQQPLGTGGGLREALRALPDADAVVVLNGDLLTGHDLPAQVARLTASGDGALACLHVREVPDPERYGSVVLDDDGRVTAFVEKSPAPPSSWINAGTYVVRPALLEVIPPDGAVSLEREVFPRLVDDAALVAHPADGYFLDVGSPDALVAANRDLVLGRSPGAPAAKGDPGPERLLLPGARLDPTAVVRDGSVVHPGAVVGAGAEVVGSVVLAGARIGAGARVVGSVIGRDSRVGAGSILTGCALGTGTVIDPAERLDRVLRPPRESPAGR